MLLQEWNWDDAKKVWQREAAEKAVKAKVREVAKNLLALGVSPDTAANAIGLDMETLKELSVQLTT